MAALVLDSPYFPARKGATNSGICDRLTSAEEVLNPIVQIKPIWLILLPQASKFLLDAPTRANFARPINSSLISLMGAVKLFSKKRAVRNFSLPRPKTLPLLLSTSLSFLASSRTVAS